MKKTLLSFALAWQNIRANLMHTLLSILGIVIGVAALVSILSLIDGLEQQAQRQISETTTVKAVMISPESYKKVGKLRVLKDSLSLLRYADARRMMADLKDYERFRIQSSEVSEVKASGQAAAIACAVSGVYNNLAHDSLLSAGRHINETDLEQGAAVAAVNAAMAKQISAPDSAAGPIGKTITYRGKTFTVVGLVKSGAEEEGEEAAEESPAMYVPLSALDDAMLRAHPPGGFIEARSVEQAPELKKQISEWLKNRYPGRESDFSVIANDFRIDQMAKAFLLFRVVMGMIVGISILVGGIGVMNVLLISVTERTQEIGIRKAVGANKWDILRLFLSESIVISAFGSMMGLLLGVLGTMAFVPIIKALTKIPFTAAYTMNTFLVISVVAVIVGVVFGTYPALKASKLDPVEAMRRD